MEWYQDQHGDFYAKTYFFDEEIDLYLFDYNRSEEDEPEQWEYCIDSGGVQLDSGRITKCHESLMKSMVEDKLKHECHRIIQA